MSIFSRIKNIIKKPEPPKPEKNVLTLGPGDIVDVSLITYQVTGRTRISNQPSALLTLQDGSTTRYLLIEERERTSYILYSAIDGRLDSFDEVPTTIEMEDGMYFLEDHHSGMTVVIGKTPFGTNGEQFVWQYQSDNRKRLRIEWQDGKFMLYEGESILPADVKALRGT